MASYQIDFKNGKGMDGSATYGLILRYTSSPIYKQAQIGWDYYMGENTTVSQLRRLYWKDGAIDPITGEKKSSGGFADNPYVANNKIGYSFFTDMITQKVDTLFREIPTIETDYKINTKFIKKFGYAMRSAAERASAQAVSYLMLDANGNINVFPADRALAFYDDETTEIRAFIRWWTVCGLSGTNTTYWEVYTEDGVITYKNKPMTIVSPLTPYKFKILSSAISTETIPEKRNGLPIVEFWNSEYKISDLSTNIRSKIDIIDIVQSGFANNIEDFSDAFWVIKTQDGGALTEQYYQDFLANIQRTRKILGEDAEMKQFQIPTEARSKFVEIMKDDLIRDGGIVDTKALTNGNLTATAIKAARSNLETRVSKFEWQAYNVANKLLDMYFMQNNIMPEYDVTFNKYTLVNQTEVIQSAISLRGTITELSYLEMLENAQIIGSAKLELENLKKENLNKYGGGGELE